MTRPTRRPRGFSALELLVVLAILALTMLIAIPNFMQYRVRTRVLGAARDLMSVASFARLHAINSHGQVALVLITPGEVHEFSGQPYAHGNTAVVFVDANPSNPTDVNNGNGKWDAAEPVVRRMMLSEGLRFKGTGTDACTSCTWAIGGTSLKQRLLFDATGNLRQVPVADPELFVSDTKGNVIRLRVNRLSANMTREKWNPGKGWMHENSIGSWTWNY